MSKYSVRIKTFARKAFEWFKGHGGILFSVAALVILVISCLKIFSLKKMSPDAKIQAALMVLLIVITGFYAYQTQRLVKEERRALEEERMKRYAEFGEKRIQKFLRPLLQKLEGLNDSLSVITESGSRPLINKFENSLYIFKARLDQIDELFSEHLFMADPILRYGILSLIKTTRKTIPTIENQAEMYVIPWKEKIEKDISELMSAVNIEISKICQHIRKTYGYFSHETKILESLDDLAVLSDRPPTRI